MNVQNVDILTREDLMFVKNVEMINLPTSLKGDMRTQIKRRNNVLPRQGTTRQEYIQEA